jgi:hypothetical protein
VALVAAQVQVARAVVARAVVMGLLVGQVPV